MQQPGDPPTKVSAAVFSVVQNGLCPDPNQSAASAILFGANELTSRDPEGSACCAHELSLLVQHESSPCNVVVCSRLRFSAYQNVLDSLPGLAPVYKSTRRQSISTELCDDNWLYRAANALSTSLIIWSYDDTTNTYQQVGNVHYEHECSIESSINILADEGTYWPLIPNLEECEKLECAAKTVYCEDMQSGSERAHGVERDRVCLPSGWASFIVLQVDRTMAHDASQSTV